MLAFAFLFLATTHVQLINEVVEVPAGDWRYVEVTLKQRPAFVSADYDIESGQPKVRLALMRREDLDRLRDDLPNGAMAVTPSAGFGRLGYDVRVRGEYALLIDNRASTTPASTRVRVSLDFGDGYPQVTQLSPERRLAVVAISFTVFFGIVFYSARKLLRGIRS